MNLLPTFTVIKTIAWTLAVIWGLNQFDATSGLLSSKNRFFR